MVLVAGGVGDGVVEGQDKEGDEDGVDEVEG